ncbi:hypothetical protein V2J09_004457 [Rumex salicifolius]
MEAEQRKLEAPGMTFDEASLERSKSFVKALQELKNLRPQLYSAAEYCEKSYLHSEQKQMVLDNLKDYSVRALVNAVDHLGTVAYKLNDLLEQQTTDFKAVDLKVTSLNQQILTCQTFMDKQGLRQQRLLAIIPRHHKRYILPSPPLPKTLTWHLASESKPSTKRNQKSSLSLEVVKNSSKPAGVFHLLHNEGNVVAKSSTPSQSPMLSRSPAFGISVQPFGTRYKDYSTGSRSMSPFRSFDNSNRQKQQQIIHAPTRTKSVLSALFAKQKTLKLKPGA